MHQRIPFTVPVLLAASIALTGCSGPTNADGSAARSPGSTAQEPAPAKTEAAGKPDGGPLTVSDRRDIPPEEWCAEVFDGLGVEEVVARASTSSAEAVLKSSLDSSDRGYLVTCTLGTLQVMRTGFQSPAMLEKQREEYEATGMADIETGSEIVRIGGIEGDYLYDAVGTPAGAVFSAFYADTESIVVTLYMPTEALSEQEAWDFMNGLVGRAGSTGVPVVIKNYG